MIGRPAALKGDAGCGVLEQMALVGVCARRFDEHVAKLCGTLGVKLDKLIDALKESCGSSVEVSKPPGGVFLWIRMPEGVAAARLTVAAAGAGVAVNPGPKWSRGADASRRIRTCFVNPSPDMMRADVAELLEIRHDVFGAPEFSGDVRRWIGA